MIACSAETAAVLEEVGIELLRKQDHRATKLLTLVLAYRAAAAVEPTPDNVVPLDSYSRRVGA
jgi:hypothetical protein